MKAALFVYLSHINRIPSTLVLLHISSPPVIHTPLSPPCDATNPPSLRTTGLEIEMKLSLIFMVLENEFQCFSRTAEAFLLPPYGQNFHL